MLAYALLAVTLFPAAASNWQQDGGDAARSAVSGGTGPAWDDVALAFRYNKTSAVDILHHNVVVVGDYAFVARPTTVMRIEWRTGANESWQTGATYGLASDGVRLFATTDSGLRAYNLTTGNLEWQANVTAGGLSLGVVAACTAPPLVREARVFVGCVLGQLPAVASYPTQGDTAAWTWPILTDPHDPADYGHLFGMASMAAYATSLKQVRALAAVGPLVYAVVDSYLPPTTHPATGTELELGTSSLHAIDAESGADVWTAGPAVPPTVFATGGRFNRWAVPTGDDAWVYVQAEMSLWRGPAGLRAYPNSTNGGTSVRLNPDVVEGDLGGGFAYDGRTLFATSATRLSALAPDLRQTRWTLEAPAEARWSATHPLLAGGTLYAVSTSERTDTLHAIDAASGLVLWERLGRFHALAVADGTLLVAGPDELLVLGRTPTSPRAEATVTTLYPEVGERLRVDVAGAAPEGQVVEYRAYWGDGTSSEWVNTSQFDYSYERAGEVEARFAVRTEDGRTSSVPITFHVGEADPAVTIFTAPFHPRFQETTFFTLGLLATAGAAIFGILRAGRKRRLFTRELRELEEEHDALRDDPGAHDRMLSTRQARARALFLERKLEDAHVSFLERRVDELRRAGRMAQVDDELEFLPHGMFRALHDVLRDARVSAFERNTFLDAVEADKRLTPAQKAHVRRLVESWFARDERVGE